MNPGIISRSWPVAILFILSTCSPAYAQLESSPGAVVVVPELPELTQPNEADIAAAEQAVAETKTLFAQADWQGALLAAERAYKHLPNANMALRWAMVYAAAKEPARSFATYLLAYSLDPTTEERTRIEAGLTEQSQLCHPPMGWVRVDVEGGAKVFVNGQQTWSGRWIGLSVGQHMLHAEPHEQDDVISLPVDVKSGTRTEISIERERDVPEPEPSTETVSVADTASPTIPETVPWIVLGSGLAVLGAAAGIHVWSSEAAETRESLSKPVSGMAEDDRLSQFKAAHQDAEDRATAAYVLYGVGGAAALTGVVLLVISETDDEAAAVLPVVSPGYVGVNARF